MEDTMTDLLSSSADSVNGINYDSTIISRSIASIFNGGKLSTEESESLFMHLFSGNISEVELSGILIAMKLRGETSEEISGAARSMRRFSTKINLGNDEIFDTCGTGGDNSHSFNISSSVALILASLGIPVAKHGNRSMSSRSGSTDFYEKLGIPVNLAGDDAVEYFKRHNFIYMAAPNYHPAMKYAAPVRKQLGTRTIFNYLGPLTNPAGTRKQAIGFFSPELLPLYAETARALSFDRALIYSSSDGMDEISPYAPSVIYEIEAGEMKSFTVNPVDFIESSEAAEIPKGLAAEDNVSIFMDTVSRGKTTPLAKLISMNAAVALYAHSSTNEIMDSYNRCLEAVNDGTVKNKIMELRESN
jgi:anthranilate phosphoribosyltransferase